MPDIVEARMASGPDDLPWRNYFTTNSAEYYGIGADGREKLIVAHGVGPMSNIEGIKRAYAWEYKDQQRRRRGGRISAEEFLRLEAGCYGQVAVLATAEDESLLTAFERFCELDSEGRFVVFVIDFVKYLEWHGSEAFSGNDTVTLALLDVLLMARLGRRSAYYLADHRKHALEWHEKNDIRLRRGDPFVLMNKGASNCSYTTIEKVDGRYDFDHPLPRPLEDGMAIGHLLSISGLAHTHSRDDFGLWEGLISDISCHEWVNGVRFLAVPAGSDWQAGVDESPDPSDVLRRRWQQLMQPADDTDYIPPRLYLLEESDGEWFTRYSKQSGHEQMDDSDVEFHVRTARMIDVQRQFTVDEDFFLRYDLARVIALAPAGVNAYIITEISSKDSLGHTTVTVQFYKADVDTSQRLPRVEEIKQNYDLLMG